MKKRKIIILSILVILIIAMICGVIWYFINKNSNYKPNGKLNYDIVLINEETNPYYHFVGIGQPDGTILLQDLYADIPYTEENKEKYLDYINNQENVDRERFKSIYEN